MLQSIDWQAVSVLQRCQPYGGTVGARGGAR